MTSLAPRLYTSGILAAPESTCLDRRARVSYIVSSTHLKQEPPPPATSRGPGRGLQVYSLSAALCGQVLLTSRSLLSHSNPAIIPLSNRDLTPARCPSHAHPQEIHALSDKSHSAPLPTHRSCLVHPVHPLHKALALSEELKGMGDNQLSCNSACLGLPGNSPKPLPKCLLSPCAIPQGSKPLRSASHFSPCG